MNSLNIFPWREKVSGRGLKWSPFLILSTMLIMNGFFILKFDNGMYRYKGRVAFFSSAKAGLGG